MGKKLCVVPCGGGHCALLLGAFLVFQNLDPSSFHSYTTICGESILWEGKLRILQLHQKLNMLGLEALGSCNATPGVATSNTIAQRLFNLNICSLNLGTYSTLQ